MTHHYTHVHPSMQQEAAAKFARACSKEDTSVPVKKLDALIQEAEEQKDVTNFNKDLEIERL